MLDFNQCSPMPMLVFSSDTRIPFTERPAEKKAKKIKKVSSAMWFEKKKH